MAEEKKFFSSKKKEEEPLEDVTEIKEEVKEEVKTETKELPKINKPKKDEKMVQVQVGVDPYGNPSWKFVPESQASKFK